MQNSHPQGIIFKLVITEWQAQHCSSTTEHVTFEPMPKCTHMVQRMRRKFNWLSTNCQQSVINCGLFLFSGVGKWHSLFVHIIAINHPVAMLLKSWVAFNIPAMYSFNPHFFKSSCIERSSAVKGGEWSNVPALKSPMLEQNVKQCSDSIEFDLHWLKHTRMGHVAGVSDKHLVCISF